MEKHHNKYYLILTLSGIFLTTGLVLMAASGLKKDVSVTTDLAYDAQTETPFKEEEADIIPPDGKYTLTVKKGMELNGLVPQSFYISSEKDSSPIKIFEKNSKPENMISVPENTFSPDNKYIFLKYDEQGKSRYLVLRTNGEEIRNGVPTVEFEGLFSEKYPEFVITDVTG